MPTGIRKCKICGKEYPYCKTNVRAGTFRYQDVACCPEHGRIYLAKVEAARAANNDSKEDSKSIEPTKKEIHQVSDTEYVSFTEDVDDDDDDIDEDEDDDEYDDE